MNPNRWLSRFGRSRRPSDFARLDTLDIHLHQAYQWDDKGVGRFTVELGDGHGGLWRGEGATFRDAVDAAIIARNMEGKPC